MSGLGSCSRFFFILQPCVTMCQVTNTRRVLVQSREGIRSTILQAVNAFIVPATSTHITCSLNSRLYWVCCLHCVCKCEQVTAAKRVGVPVVHPDWLLACKFGWARPPEAAFSLPGYAGAGPGGLNGGSSRLLALGNAAAAAAEREKRAVMKGAGRTNV
jgi:hypothetical protein